MSQLSQLPSSQHQAFTQELDDCTFELLSTTPDTSIWGRLYPRKPFLKTIELKKDCSYTFGRGEECSEQFLEQDFKPHCNGMFLTVSKVHFKIGQRLMCSGQNCAFLKDLSSNGTFINGLKVGKDQSRVLAHNDTISLLNPTLEVYTYSATSVTENAEIPVEVRREYAMAQKLGKGAQGTVFLCFHKVTAEARALKKILKTKVSNVLNEVQILSKLKHNHIVRMMGHIDTMSAVFIVMEHMAGDLTKLLEGGNHLKEPETKIIFYQITQAVEYLHHNRIIHRDLKPENILLLSNDSLYIKITDFGLSKHNTTLTCPDTICGTPNYLAPEVLRVNKSGPYDEKVDVWSMGVILFLCLSGTLPFQHMAQYMFNYNSRYNFSAKPWEVVSLDAKVLVKNMLVMDPSKRISISKICNDPWISQDADLKSQIAELYCRSKVQI